MRLLAVLSLSAAVATSATVSAAPPAAASQPAPPQSAPRAGTSAQANKARLQLAIEHYQRSEFDAALRLLTELARTLGTARDRVAQETFTYLAFVHAAFGRAEAAVSSFERALAVKADLTLESPSPKLARLLLQARERYRAKLRALDHDPPRLSHRPPAGLIRYGVPLRIETRAEDLSAVKDVTLSYRNAGHRGYATLRMERDRDGTFVASIPQSAIARPALEYYIEAWDTLGNGPGLKGSSRAPIRVGVEGGPLVRAPRGPSSWYQKWWVWAIAAGVVATAAGVSVGAYLGREQTARINVGGLGALGK